MTTLIEQAVEATKDRQLAVNMFANSGHSLLSKLRAEFSLNGGEVREVATSLDDYGHAYRQYGTAQIVSNYFKESGIPFTENLPDPMVEHTENIRKAALATISVLRELGCDSQDINFISDDLKKHGEAGRILGNAEGILMVLKL
jgi:hypothetical protein